MTGDCVETTGVLLDKDGYPRIKHQKRIWRLNRLIFTLVHGDIPPGMVVGHRCNNKGCINPAHLYLTTAAQNSSDAARDGLYRRGHRKPSILTAAEDWEHLCQMYHEEGISQQEISDLYGVSQPRISELIRKHTPMYLGEQR